MTEKTATEQLREMLDERGVEWKAWDSVHPITVWHDEQFVYEYLERTLLDGVKPYTGEVVDGTGRLEAVARVCTPEQAIAATLGDDDYERKMDALLCRLTNGKFSKSRAYDLDFMESCVNEEFEMLYADELNATLGGGECKWVWVESWTDTTDGRECDYAHWMPDCGCWSEGDYQFSDFDDYEEKPTGIVFCERCGKAVK